MSRYGEPGIPTMLRSANDEVSSSRFTRELSERTEDRKHGCGIELLGLFPRQPRPSMLQRFAQWSVCRSQLDILDGTVLV